MRALAVVLVSLIALIGPLPAAASQPLGDRDLRLEGGPWLPYRVNRGKLIAEAGFRGAVELRGTRWDGSHALLFRADASARTRSMDLAFYMDEETRSLSLSVGEGPTAMALEIPIDPPPAESAGGPFTDASAKSPAADGAADGAALMRALQAPQRLASSERSSKGIELDGSALASAGARIASRLFFAPPPVAAFLALAVAAIGASLATGGLARGGLWGSGAGGGRGLAGDNGGLVGGANGRVGGAGGWSSTGRKLSTRGTASLLLLAASVVGGSVATAALASRSPVLFRAELPLVDPSAPLWGSLGRRLAPKKGWLLVECAGVTGESPSSARGEGSEPASGGLLLLGMEPGSGPGLPLEEIAPIGALVRFSSAPLVEAREGSFMVRVKTFISGWAIHGRE